MFPYLIIACFISFFTLEDSIHRIKKDQRDRCIWGLEILLICFAGLRDNIGTDYQTYKDMFDGLHDIEDVERGFQSLIKLCSNLNIPSEASMFLLSGITLFFAFRYMTRYSPMVFLSILIFFCFGQFFFNTFNTVRQSVVVYWFLSSLNLIRDKKISKIVLGVLILSHFVHLSSLYLMILYFICQVKVSKLLKIIALGGVYLLGKIALDLIAMSPYAVYANFEFAQTRITSLQLILFILSLYLIIYPPIISDHRISRIFQNLNFVNSCLSVAMISISGSPIVLVFTRLLYYTTPIYIILIPYMINQWSLKSNKELIAVIVSLLFISTMIASLSLNGTEYKLTPYKSILS